MSPHAPQLICDRLQQGILPRKPPAKMFVGHGPGRTCDGCDQPIHPEELEYEFDADGRTFWLHSDCARLLQLEGQKVKAG